MADNVVAKGKQNQSQDNSAGLKQAVYLPRRRICALCVDEGFLFYNSWLLCIEELLHID